MIVADLHLITYLLGPPIYHDLALFATPIASLAFNSHPYHFQLTLLALLTHTLITFNLYSYYFQLTLLSLLTYTLIT